MMPIDLTILRPVVALAAWSLLVLIWLVATRAPALKRAGIDIRTVSGGRPGLLDTVLPEKTQYVAHNYIHLMEQPTLFYAVALVLAVAGGGAANAGLAWAYVGLRVLHTLVQATFNRVAVRFALFAVGTVVLIVLTARAAALVFA